jgi:hypothetical protein
MCPDGCWGSTVKQLPVQILGITSKFDAELPGRVAPTAIYSQLFFALTNPPVEDC